MFEETGIEMGKNFQAKRFGTIALEKGFITKEQFIEALKIQVKENVEEMGHQLIGTILFALGAMTREQIMEVIDVISKETVHD